MRLHDIADVYTTGEDILPDDILLQRVGTLDTVGTPFMGEDKQRTKNTITIRLTEQGMGIVLPRYLYYMLQALHMNGYFKRLAVGSLQQAIRVSDVQEIQLG